MAKNAEAYQKLLDFLDYTLEPALRELSHRWEDEIPPHVRAEIMVQTWEPVIHVLISAGRRPVGKA